MNILISMIENFIPMQDYTRTTAFSYQLPHVGARRTASPRRGTGEKTRTLGPAENVRILLYNPGCAFTASGRLSHRSGLRNIAQTKGRGRGQRRSHIHIALPRTIAIPGTRGMRFAR